MYLDKPMRNHTLMQTIARANRVFPGKHSGLIVDYANVFASLDDGLPRVYAPDVFQQKCVTLFEHVFESYGGAGGYHAGEAA